MPAMVHSHLSQLLYVHIHSECKSVDPIKQGFKMYTLRNVMLSAMKRPDDIKNEIFE